MPKSIKKLIKVLLVAGLFLANFLMVTPAISAAEIPLRCANGDAFDVSPEPVITLNSTGFSMPHQYTFTFSMQEPVIGSGDTPRAYSAYRIAYNIGQGWNSTPITFSDSDGDGVFTGSITLNVLNGREPGFYTLEFAPQLSSAGFGSDQDICKYTIQVQMQPAEERLQEGIILQGTCASYSTISSQLSQSHFTCRTNGSGDPDLIDNVGGGCIGNNVTANENRCSQQPANSVVCLPCTTETTTPIQDQLDNLEHGDVCTNIEGASGLTCASNPEFICRQSLVEPNERKCLAAGSLDSTSDECFGGENECAASGITISGEWGGLFCLADSTTKAANGEVGYCSTLTCDISSRPIAASSSCASATGVADSYCAGAENGDSTTDGTCVTRDQLEDLIEDPGFIDHLEARGVNEASINQALADLGIGGIDPGSGDGGGDGNGDGGGTGAPVVGSSSDYGIRNCPGATQFVYLNGVLQQDPEGSGIPKKLPDNQVAFEPSLGATEQEYQQCSSCIILNGTWTALGCIGTTPQALFSAIIRVAIGVMGGIALLRLIYLGFQYQTGEEGKIAEARKGVLATLGAIIIILFSVLILRIIGVNLLDVVPAGFFG